MAIHHPNLPLLIAGQGHPREGLSRDLLLAKNIQGDSGALKRFERYIYPHLGINPQPTEDFLDSLIQRNSWLR